MVPTMHALAQERCWTPDRRGFVPCEDGSPFWSLGRESKVEAFQSVQMPPQVRCQNGPVRPKHSLGLVSTHQCISCEFPWVWPGEETYHLVALREDCDSRLAPPEALPWGHGHAWNL